MAVPLCAPMLQIPRLQPSLRLGTPAKSRTLSAFRTRPSAAQGSVRDATRLIFQRNGEPCGGEHDAVVRKGLIEQRIVAGHVLDILGCGKRHVNEDRVIACKG
jgi:hypothetical protein